jgi:hypothetical protein
MVSDKTDSGHELESMEVVKRHSNSNEAVTSAIGVWWRGFLRRSGRVA